MGFGLPELIPATSIRGTDQYLIVGIDGMECVVIDQDGDLRTVNMQDIKTKYVHLPKIDVWFSTQNELDQKPAVPPHEDDSSNGED